MSPGLWKVQTREGEKFYQGPFRPNPAATRMDAARFVVQCPEDQRILKWIESEGEQQEAAARGPYRCTLWRGAEPVGLVRLKAPLEGHDSHWGTFYPGPVASAFRPLLETTVVLNRQASEALGSPENEAANEPLFEAWCAASDVIADLGLAIGDPPRRITTLRL
jgi:hypothetical protein